MRISVVAGDRSVYIKVKGNGPKALARAEAAAARLLPAEAPAAQAKPFGFGATSDHEVADPPSSPHLGVDHAEAHHRAEEGPRTAGRDRAPVSGLSPGSPRRPA